MSVRPDGAFHRAPRPLIGWGGVVLVAFCLLFLAALGGIFLYAIWRWANGLPLDLMGIAAVLTAAVPAGAAIWSFVKRYLFDRHMERMDQQARGTAPGLPFPQPPPASPGGGLVNEEAIR